MGEREWRTAAAAAQTEKVKEGILILKAFPPHLTELPEEF